MLTIIWLYFNIYLHYAITLNMSLMILWYEKSDLDSAFNILSSIHSMICWYSILLIFNQYGKRHFQLASIFNSTKGSGISMRLAQNSLYRDIYIFYGLFCSFVIAIHSPFMRSQYIHRSMNQTSQWDARSSRE